MISNGLVSGFHNLNAFLALKARCHLNQGQPHTIDPFALLVTICDHSCKLKQKNLLICFMLVALLTQCSDQPCVNPSNIWRTPLWQQRKVLRPGLYQFTKV